jgi:membrane-bound lytic murein transglycosylase D
MKKLLTIIVPFILFHSFSASANSFSDTSLSAKQVVSSAKFPDTTLVPVVNHIPAGIYSNVLVKRRLDSIQKDIPLDYNEYVQTYIDLYMKRKDEMGHIAGLSKYYFPIYEKAFRDAGIPEEIKFLSIVESELNPNAVSRVGATGPWQFMYETARLYGLNMDEYVDERRDPIQASYAAAAYLKDAYQEFGDWLLAIASYNCGKSNVIRAMEKAGGANDFWSIRPYLPAETRGYVPAYIAMSYVMSYYKRHSIILQPCNFSLKTDTILVNKYVPLSSIAQVLGIELREMAILNPAYKRMIVNGSPKSPRRLVIPEAVKEKYSALYDVLNDGHPSSGSFRLSHASYAENSTEEREVPSHHKVRKGETLTEIADRYGITVQDLKVWNNLHSYKVKKGMELRLTEETRAAHHQPVLKFVTYKVRRGDTIFSIADKFDGVTVAKIKEMNGLKNSHLQPGMKLKIAHS